MVGVSLDQKENKMKKYEEKHQFQFRSYSDLSKRWKSTNAERFGVDGIPACYVVDSQSKVLLVDPQANQFESWIDALVAL